MSKNKKADRALPLPVESILKDLGRSVQIARKRRRLSESKLAALAYTSRATIQRLEAGEPGVGMGILASVLWVLQLHQDLARVADPGRDQLGTLLERGREPKRIREGVTGDDAYDF
ncbi:helix-turn-helix domain-containing protein [Desulfovibrio psychrotolerans]|uniref:Transcriptional regulator n=1 Tax=Desulfovibrio psychrotolerans TaxID=415242 RepID=A0A7J0BYC3_9BACT|nr:helix-turn-helix domain-containing protein [Desulfovibrio psychrotolerans]GFM38195.1 transcriptional regulator [Desulfovibrio psychrotolerans]